MASSHIDSIKWTLMLSCWGPNQSENVLVSLPDSISWVLLYKVPPAQSPSFQTKFPLPLLTNVSLVTKRKKIIKPTIDSLDQQGTKCDLDFKYVLISMLDLLGLLLVILSLFHE